MHLNSAFSSASKIILIFRLLLGERCNGNTVFSKDYTKQPAVNGGFFPGLHTIVNIIFNEIRYNTNDYLCLFPLFQIEKNLPSVSAFLIS